jgi:hypothetical protein
MAVDLNDPNARARTSSVPSGHFIPALQDDSLSFAHGCLVATAASAVLWLLFLWTVFRFMVR